jgi:hypothetical protein
MRHSVRNLRRRGTRRDDFHIRAKPALGPACRPAAARAAARPERPNRPHEPHDGARCGQRQHQCGCQRSHPHFGDADRSPARWSPARWSPARWSPTRWNPIGRHIGRTLRPPGLRADRSRQRRRREGSHDLGGRRSLGGGRPDPRGRPVAGLACRRTRSRPDNPGIRRTPGIRRPPGIRRGPGIRRVGIRRVGLGHAWARHVRQPAARLGVRARRDLQHRPDRTRQEHRRAEARLQRRRPPAIRPFRLWCRHAGTSKSRHAAGARRHRVMRTPESR